MADSLKQFEDKMDGALRHLDKEFGAIRAGRANPAVLDKVMVDYYGAPTPINQMAAVSVTEARILTIAPWDASTLKDIEHAILVSDVGINPTNDGKTLRLPFPAPTEERRKQLVKDAMKLGEDAKVAIRNVRRDAMDYYKDLEKKKEISEDELSIQEAKIQKITDKFTKEVDTMCDAKTKEISEV